MQSLFSAVFAACALAFSAGAFAVSTADGVSFSCSSGDFASIAGDGYTASCGGDFEVSGGELSSDAWISLSAGGSLRVDSAALIAPRIELNAGTLTLSAGSAFGLGGGPVRPAQGISIIGRVGGVSLDGGSGTTLTTIAGGGDVSIGGTGSRIDGNTGGGVYLVNAGGIVFTDRLGVPAVLSVSANGRGNLDRIILSQVPEAPVFLMWLVGIGVLAGLRRRVSLPERLVAA